jgi:hypothetical protein
LLAYPGYFDDYDYKEMYLKGDDFRGIGVREFRGVMGKEIEK